MVILVTGGSGTLGRPTVVALRAAGHDVRVLSRRPGPDRVVGDLNTGTGLDAALAGVTTVVHLATSISRRDIAQTSRLLEASRAAGVTHVVYVSIVGADRVPYSYYRAKVACEDLIVASGIGFTVVRATQFHEFIHGLIEAQKRLPVLITLDIPDQPIAAAEVAETLVAAVEAGPRGRVADLGGPEQLPLRTLMEQWQHATATSRRIVTLRLPLRMLRAMRAGHHLATLPGHGRQRFADYAAATHAAATTAP